MANNPLDLHASFTGFDEAIRVLRDLELSLAPGLRGIARKVMLHEKELFESASPIGEDNGGQLKASYEIIDEATGVALTNAVDWFRLNITGTGQRGAAAGVPRDLFSDFGSYGSQPGMAPNPALLHTWEMAPAEMEAYADTLIGSLLDF